MVICQLPYFCFLIWIFYVSFQNFSSGFRSLPSISISVEIKYIFIKFNVSNNYFWIPVYSDEYVNAYLKDWYFQEYEKNFWSYSHFNRSKNLITLWNILSELHFSHRLNSKYSDSYVDDFSNLLFNFDFQLGILGYLRVSFKIVVM